MSLKNKEIFITCVMAFLFCANPAEAVLLDAVSYGLEQDQKTGIYRSIQPDNTDTKTILEAVGACGKVALEGYQKTIKALTIMREVAEQATNQENASCAAPLIDQALEGVESSQSRLESVLATLSLYED